MHIIRSYVSDIPACNSVNHHLTSNLQKFLLITIFWKELFVEKEDRVMRGKLILLGFVLLLIMVGCAPTSYFGVPNKAIIVPAEFKQTEAAIANAERSAGAKYCPEKIARAKGLGKQAAEIYWICRTAEAMGLLAQARDLAKEAESCQPPPPPPPPPPPHSTATAPTTSGEAAHQLPLGAL